MDCGLQSVCGWKERKRYCVFVEWISIMEIERGVNDITREGNGVETWSIRVPACLEGGWQIIDD